MQSGYPSHILAVIENVPTSAKLTGAIKYVLVVGIVIKEGSVAAVPI